MKTIKNTWYRSYLQRPQRKLTLSSILYTIIKQEAAKKQYCNIISDDTFST